MSFSPYFITCTMSRREAICFIVILCSVFSCTRGQDKEQHVQLSRKTNYQLKKALVSVDEIIHQLSSLTNATETCNTQLEKVTKNLNTVCKKIIKQGESEVSLTKRGIVDRIIHVDIKKEYCACVDRLRSHCSELYAEIWCLRHALWKNNHYNRTTDELAKERLFGSNFHAADNAKGEVTLKRGKRDTEILELIAPTDITQPTTGHRIRKEYRALTLAEREKYHKAVKKLYENGVFSCFARVHRFGIREKGVHRGEAFLPWHRAFLALYEEALRKIDSNVSLPYWDSTIDFNSDSPVFSVMWDEKHLGTGFGNVTNGAFANFATDDNPLKRKIGNKGSLMKPARIAAILEGEFCRMGDIFKRLEGAHNSVHRWVGATMARRLSASDPVFYMHHAFIDLIWEEFRKKQKSAACNGTDPGSDYPFFDETALRPTKPEHMADEEMDGMEFLRNRQGIENFWTTNWYGYAERPSCADNCSNSDDMYCDNNVCVAVLSEDLGNEPLPTGRRKRQAVYPPYSSQLYATYRVTSLYEGNNTSICRTQPYHRSCPTPDPPTTVEGIASAIINGELPMPDKLAKLNKKIKRLRDRNFETPPESDPVFFTLGGDVGNDCRTIDTALYDLLIKKLRGKKIVARHS